MTSPILSLSGLEKSYGDVRALDGLSFELEPGPVGLLGRNGAGKTTLLKLLLGLLAPDAGTARIAGHDPSTSAGRLAVRRSVGYMPEGDCLLPDTTAVELVTTLARLSGVSATDAMTRAHEVLDYVGIDEARYRSADEYSTGMKQRLKLAQALVHDPPLLLLDEPTNGLDPRGRKQMLDLVHDLGWNQGKSLLLCSHLLPDVERCCRDVVVLEKGRVRTQGAIAAMTGPAGLVVHVRIAGDGGTFERAARARGLDLAPGTDGGWRVTLAARDADLVFAAALDARVEVTAIDPARSSLEDVFLSTLERSDARVGVA